MLSIVVINIYAIIVLCSLKIILSYPNILVFGDSIDRYMSEDVCLFINNATSWEENEIAFHRFQWQDRSLTTVRIYGSSVAGPYLHNEHEGSGPKLTPRRLEVALHSYYTRYPAPDIIYIHTTAWDYQYQAKAHKAEVNALNNQSSPIYQAAYQQFTITMRQTVELLQTLVEKLGQELANKVKLNNSNLAHNVSLAATSAMAAAIQADNQLTEAAKLPILGLRSHSYCNNPIGREINPNHEKCTRLVLAMNSYTHHLAQELSLLYFDGQSENWDTFGYQYQYEEGSKLFFAYLYKDFIHPSQMISHDAGLKFLGIQYSRAILDYSASARSNKSLRTSVRISNNNNNNNSLVVSRVPFPSSSFVAHNYYCDDDHQSSHNSYHSHSNHHNSQHRSRGVIVFDCHFANQQIAWQNYESPQIDQLLQHWLDQQLIIKLIQVTNGDINSVSSAAVPSSSSYFIHYNQPILYNNNSTASSTVASSAVHQQQQQLKIQPLCKMKVNLSAWSTAPSYYSASPRFHLSAFDLFIMPLSSRSSSVSELTGGSAHHHRYLLSSPAAKQQMEASLLAKFRFLEVFTKLPSCFLPQQEQQQARTSHYYSPRQQQQLLLQPTLEQHQQKLQLYQILSAEAIITLPLIFTQSFCRGVLIYTTTSINNNSSHHSNTTTTMIWIHDLRSAWDYYTGDDSHNKVTTAAASSSSTIEQLGFHRILAITTTELSSVMHNTSLLEDLRDCSKNYLYIETVHLTTSLSSPAAWQLLVEMFRLQQRSPLSYADEMKKKSNT